MNSFFSQSRILGGASVLAATQLAASVMGLLRDRFLTKTFPGLDTVDVYIAAFRPSDLLFQMFIMAGFSVALVPLLAKHKAEDDQKTTNEFFSSIITFSLLVFTILALALALALPYIAHYLTNFQNESLTLYVSFARIALLTNLLFVLGNACGQYLITAQRYWIYGLTPVLYTLGTILGTVFLTPSLGAFGPITGTLLGAFVYVILRLGAVVVLGFKPKLQLWHPELLEVGRLMLPRMIALGALQAQLLLFDTVASGLGSGAVTINAYARNFQSVVVGVVGIALAQSAFSLLSQAAAKKETSRFWVYLKKGTVMMLLLTIPGAVILSFLAPVAAWLVHLSHVLPVFSIALMLYSISIPFESCNHLLLRSYYALKQTKIPAVLSIVNGGVAILVAYLLSPTYGVFALALGFTAGQVIQGVGLWVMLPGEVRKNR